MSTIGYIMLKVYTCKIASFKKYVRTERRVGVESQTLHTCFEVELFIYWYSRIPDLHKTFLPNVASARREGCRIPRPCLSCVSHFVQTLIQTTFYILITHLWKYYIICICVNFDILCFLMDYHILRPLEVQNMVFGDGICLVECCLLSVIYHQRKNERYILLQRKFCLYTFFPEVK